jgi:hypothetical protein
MGIAYNTSVVRDGLVLYLDAANRKSYSGTGTNWTDLSGSGNNGTLTDGPTFSSGNLANFTFNNNSADYTLGGHVEVQNTASLNNINSFSLSFVLYSLGTQSGNGGSVFHKANESNTGFICEPLSDNIRINYGNGTTWFWSAINTALIHNEYASYTYTYDGSTLHIYKNSQLLSSHSITIAWDNTNIVSIGRRRGHLFHKLYGRISSEMLHTTTLSSTQIQQNFNALRGRYSI